MSEPALTPQPRVDRHFDSSAAYWNDVYGGDDLQGLIYRRRMEEAAAWVRDLGPQPGTAALDVGCGAGLMTAELAGAGYDVTGIDSSASMVQTARRALAEHGLGDRVTLTRADVHQLPFEADQFALVVALGVLPWLHDPASAVTELARVLAPGGTLILTADNRRRLNRLVELRENPLLGPLRPISRTVRSRGGRSYGAPSYRHTPHEVDAMLSNAGIAVVRRATVGYGPFTLLGRRLLPDAVGRSLHERLAVSTRRHPRLRGVGWHYLVAGVKRA